MMMAITVMLVVLRSLNLVKTLRSDVQIVNSI